MSDQGKPWPAGNPEIAELEKQLEQRDKTIDALMIAVERLKAIGEALEIANHTLKRRNETLEKERK